LGFLRLTSIENLALVAFLKELTKEVAPKRTPRNERSAELIAQVTRPSFTDQESPVAEDWLDSLNFLRALLACSWA
jgi:hypothetical protein